MRSKNFLSLSVRDFICLRNFGFINVLHMHDEISHIFTVHIIICYFCCVLSKINKSVLNDLISGLKKVPKNVKHW